MQNSEARTLVQGALIQHLKRGNWTPCKFLAIDSASRVWIEEQEPSSVFGFDVISVTPDQLRFTPVRTEGMWGVSARYHGSDGEPTNTIYTFRTREDADNFCARHYGSSTNSDFIEILAMPAMVAGR